MIPARAGRAASKTSFAGSGPANPSGTHPESIRRPTSGGPDEFVHAEMVHGLDRTNSSIPSPPQAPLAGPLSGRQPSALSRHLPDTGSRRACPQAYRTGTPPGVPTDVDGAKVQTLLGDYVEKVWWPTWKAQHPDSAYQTGKRIEKRILPFFGHLSFTALDADRVGAWKASLAGCGLKPASVNSYLSLLGTILNAAVDSNYLPHSPLMRRSRAGRVAAGMDAARHPAAACRPGPPRTRPGRHPPCRGRAEPAWGKLPPACDRPPLIPVSRFEGSNGGVSRLGRRR